MRRISTCTACLALMATLTSPAIADPIMGDVTLTVTENQYGGLVGGISQPSLTYSSGTVDLSQLFQEQVSPDGSMQYSPLTLNGPLLVKWYGLGEATPPNVTYDMKITFNGASGSQPTIEVTGSMKVVADSVPDSNYPFGGPVIVRATANPASATVQGWTPSSGVPQSLIDSYLNTSSYGLYQQDSYTAGIGKQFPTSSTFDLMANPSALTVTPEPSTILVYLAAIAGLSLRRSSRIVRARS